MIKTCELLIVCMVLLAGCSTVTESKKGDGGTKKIPDDVKLSFLDEPLDLSAYNLKLLYEADFSKPQRIIHEDELFEKDAEGKMRRVREVPKKYDWVHEGQTHLKLNDGRLEFHTYKEGTEWSEKTKSHMVLWNKRTFPANFLLEFDMSPIDPKEGLAIIFFCAKGFEGEDVFALNQPYRNGEFKRYNRGEFNCYHTSYWAGRGYSNLRKNPGAKIVASGKDNVIVSEPGEKVRVRLLKVGGQIRVESGGRQALIWKDEENIYGSGNIGLRNMGHSNIVSYGYFKVWEVKTKK